MNNPVIKTENLTFTYHNGPLVLCGVDLCINSGEFVAILGHNGSGKSTLIKQFNGILLPGGGKVYALGYDTNNPDLIFEIRKNVGMVFQNPDNQIVATIVEEDVAFGLENLGIPRDEMHKRIDDALEAVDMLDYKLNATYQLSGGQKQRIAIAGILAMRPTCIVLDEPTAMLDPKGRKEVMKTIQRLNSELGITIILVTHNMDEALLASRVIVMERGKIAMDGTPREVFSEAEKLSSLRLSAPQAVELILRLNRLGMNLPSCLTIEECAAALLSSSKGGAKDE